MHGVLGTADLLRQTRLDGEQAELVEILRSSATALLTVINDMLDLQKAEAGHMELACVPVDAGALVAGVIDVLGSQAEEKGLELDVSVDEAIPRDLLGDPGRLRQILLNLLANAVKFTDAGTVSVGARLDAITDGSATLALVVADTGIGIPSEAQELIFEPFAQVDTSSSRRHEGTGLGLSITKQLVELMEGAISLESTPGKGTTVTAVVRLLRGRGAVLPQSPPVLISHELAGTVLVAEDSPVNRELALRQLSRLGLTARAVESGAAAVDALERDHYDLVLMDMRMPEMSGAAATHAIRERERETGRPRTTIVAMTANAMLENRAACLDAGMDDFATKPLLLDDLAALLGRWLEKGGEAGREAERASDIFQTGEREASIEAALELLAEELGSVDVVRRVTEQWLVEMPKRIDEIRIAESAGEAAKIRDVAHLLKSACALVGAERAGMLAASTERQAIDGRAISRGEIEDLVVEIEQVTDVVRAWHEAGNSITQD
jgi:CheY-like chemotaxis protein/HPt (histidine-containing phosphotransfer) domain-containing protein